MRVTVTARQHLAASMRAYAEEKLQRLDRHAHVQETTLLIDHDARRVPACTAEVIIHAPGTRLVVSVDAATVREAIDLVVDRADRRVLRRKERVASHRSRAGRPGDEPSEAGGAEADDAPAPEEITGLTAQRRVELPTLDLDGAMEEARGREEPYLLYIPRDRGDVALLLRRHDGYELVIGDAR